MSTLKEMYQQMVGIRIFEEKLLSLFDQGLLSGTTHTYIGQEANAVAVMNCLQGGDIVFSNHRCHGHYLARFDDPEGLLAEIMGKESGICGGRGGSQHLYRENFYSNGIQGGFSPIVVGMALAEKMKKSSSIAVSFIGDGTLGQGVFYESMNLASLMKVPLLIVIENNRYAQTTPVQLNLAGSMTKRAEAFGITSSEIESTDVLELMERFKSLISAVRCEQRPHVEVIHTYRLRAHSKGDDFRDKEEINSFAESEPLILAEREIQDISYCQGIKALAQTRIDEIVNRMRSQTSQQEA